MHTARRFWPLALLGLCLLIGSVLPVGEKALAQRSSPTGSGYFALQGAPAPDALPGIAANRILHAESEYTFQPYWGRYSYPDADLTFVVAFIYPDPYIEIVGDPTPGNYVTTCAHDPANHRVVCEGVFPKGTPGGSAARFTFTFHGTCALFPNPPVHVAMNGQVVWGDGQPPSELVETFDVSPVLEFGMIGSEPMNGAQDVPIIAADGTSPVLRWTPYQALACSMFPAPDPYDVFYNVTMRRKGGAWQTVGGGGNCERQIPLTPAQLPCAENGAPVTWEWKVLANDLKYGRCRVQNPVETEFAFTAGSCRPEVKVEPQYGNAHFLQFVHVENTYRAEVDWTGSAFAAAAQPPYGDVHFLINGQETVVPGQVWGAAHTVDMGSAFQADYSGGKNTVEIYATYTPPGSEQQESAHYTAQPKVYPYPEWASTFSLGPFSVKPGVKSVTYILSVQYPLTPFEAKVTLPGWVPYLGGSPIGLLATQAGAAVGVESTGSGKLGVSGQTGLGLGVEILGKIIGNGTFLLGREVGLKLVKSSFGLSIAAALKKSLTLGDLMPGLRSAEEWAIVGRFIKKLNNAVKVTASLVPKVRITAYFAQQGHQDWQFTGSTGRGEIGMMLRGDLKLLEKLYAWAEGGGVPYLELNFPPAPDYFKELGVDLTAYAGLRAWAFKTEFRRGIICSIPQLACREKRWDDLFALSLDDASWELTPRDYIGEGYAEFVGASPPVGAQEATASATTETPVVENVYPHSEPALAVRDDGQRTLLYLHDDPAKPLGQGMELMATQWNGAAWSPPITLTDDLNLDFSPSVAYDDAGNALAVWERSHTDAITHGLTVEFMQGLEIATAEWISATHAWGPVTLLTQNDDLADLAPRLRRGQDGALAALWETSDGEDLLGSAEHPITYTYAFWQSGAGSWTAPTPALVGLTNTLGMDVALYAADEGALVYVWDADAVSTTVGAELFYSLWDGVDWSAPVRLTNDDVSDTAPSLAYDADGALKLLWLRAGDLVMLDGAWDLAALQTVRTASEAAPLARHALVRSPAGHLAVLWQAGHEDLVDLAYRVWDASAGRWSEDLYLTNDAALEIAPSLAFDNAGVLHLAYRKEETVYVTETVEFSPTLTVTFTNVARAGASDLYVAEHTVGRDLTIGELALTPTDPAPGAPVTLTAVVRNLGDLVAGPVTVRFEDDGVPITTTLAATDMTAGAALTVTIHWTAPPILAGERTLSATVDPAGAIAELDEANNTATLAALGPHLVAEWAGVEVGQAITCTLGVTNAGSSAASAPITVSLMADDPFTGTLIVAGEIISDVARGAGATAALVVTGVARLPASGWGWLVAGAPEEGLANAWPVALAALPDLTLGPEDIAAEGYDALTLLPPGPFTVTLHNRGIVTATEVALAVRSGGLEGTLVYTGTVASIPPGAEAGVAFSHTLAAPGGALWLVVDPEDAVAEADETDNLAVWRWGAMPEEELPPVLLPIIRRP